MARSLPVFLLVTSTLLLLSPAWLQQAQAATYTIPWDFRKTRHVKPPYWMIPGDKLVFKWTDSVWHDLWIMDDEKAFKSCDFTRAKQLRPLGVGGQYTYKVTELRMYYFASRAIMQCTVFGVKGAFLSRMAA